MSSTVEQALEQMGQLLLNNAVVQVFPIVSAALADIKANPAIWINPATGFLKGMGVLGQLEGAVPGIETSSTSTAASIVQAIIAAGMTDLTPASLPTPVAIAAELIPPAPAAAPAGVAGIAAS